MSSTANESFDDLKTQPCVASRHDGDLVFEIDFCDEFLDIVPFLGVISDRGLDHLAQAI